MLMHQFRFKPTFLRNLFVSGLLQLQIIWISKMKAVLEKKTMETERICIINVGLFRSGTTFLAEGAKELGLRASDVFPPLSDDDFNDFLHQPKKLVCDWYSTNGLKEILDIILKNDIICDGWFALLPFLPSSELEIIKQKALENGIKVEFVATSRDVKCTVTSELQHWVFHDLEQKAKLTDKQREKLEKSIFRRAVHHDSEIKYLEEKGILSRLQLPDRSKWSRELSLISTFDEKSWSEAFQKTGIQNANPVLPIEGILLTFRLGDSIEESKNKVSSIEALLNQIEEDSICQYLLVLGIDVDEVESDSSRYLQQKLKSRLETNPQFRTFHVLKNQPYEEAFNICSVWNEMAVVAWENNASWVVLLGDDIELQCSYHYRAFYRKFLDIAKHLNVPLGFGCPWWNDVSFPRFPSFPCVGKAHFEIFNQLIPEHRQHSFVNQDLDPYLHRLYCKFMASPCILKATLSNKTGGDINSSGEPARYKRVSSGNWKDFVEKDTEPIKKYLEEKSHGELKEAILLDVVVPSYRVRLDYLEKICCLKVPNYMQTLFIIIIDNPNALVNAVMSLIRRGCHNDDRETIDLNRSESVLEEYLSSKGGNDVRVRCNKTNLGASASRNRGLDESAANFVLNLDDDLIPNTDLLFRYGYKLRTIESDVCGLVGLVKFPRAQDLHLKHAAILMSYLTFMFEIAETSNGLYGGGPAWGVTANILFKRTPVRFDMVYAKTGGGEDVDFSLRVSSETKGRLVSVPEAMVVHPFWPGSCFDLSCHFFGWANGDSALFGQFPEYTYYSFPNAAETLLFIVPPLIMSMVLKDGNILNLLLLVLAIFGADLFIDVIDQEGYKHRCLQLQNYEGNLLDRSCLFYFLAHVLANLYVIILEMGRLYGHIITQGKPFQGLCKRFDWHVEKLLNARQNFRRREAYKFCLFLVILFLYTYDRWHSKNTTINPVCDFTTDKTVTCIS